MCFIVDAGKCRSFTFVLFLPFSMRMNLENGHKCPVFCGVMSVKAKAGEFQHNLNLVKLLDVKIIAL